MQGSRGGATVLRAWGSGPAKYDNFENSDAKMVHSDAIWNDILELQRQFVKQGRAQTTNMHT